MCLASEKMKKKISFSSEIVKFEIKYGNDIHVVHLVFLKHPGELELELESPLGHQLLFRGRTVQVQKTCKSRQTFQSWELFNHKR